MEDNQKIVFLFSGQGSQYRGMGIKLFKRNLIFKNSLEKSDLIVKKHLNRSLIDELYTEKNEVFDDLLITHPAIVAVEIAMYNVIKEMNVKPDFVAGNSLGEFTAAVVKGIWSEEMAIEASIEQAKSIVRNDSKGGMLVVLNQKRKEVEKLYHQHELTLASDNFDGHFTLSGSVKNLDSFQSELDRQGVEFVRLAVNYPFHSSLIEGGRYGFEYYSESIPAFSNPKSGFISGLECDELLVIPKNYFWDVVSKYNDFSKMVKYIENKGTCLYIDLGPSGTSATFVNYNLGPLSNSKTFQIMSPFKREERQLKALEELLFL
ncbi:acyltransferase domain-containing protein [Flavobacterium sp. H122]|uniref:acyltransferase domain-containing protein n=1 Tax=Flavobacterium sp. H122 TaxID=2529860 RepID=UPI0010AAD8D3|nr:acyltransferase domain-containing protein [Flavobacterium sp. H122]